MSLVVAVHDEVIKQSPNAVRKYGSDALGNAILNIVNHTDSDDVKKLAALVINSLKPKVNEMDKSQPASSRGAEGLATGSKGTPARAKDVTGDALVSLDQAYEKGRFGKAPRGSKSLKGMSDIELVKKLTNVDEAKKKAKKKKPKPTSPQKWAAAKAKARSKFDVYPSAYANAWAAKEYKRMGGGWRMGESINEGVITDNDMKKINRLEKLIAVLKSVKNPEQLATAAKYYELVVKTFHNKPLEELSFTDEPDTVGDLGYEASQLFKKKKHELSSVDEGQIYSTGGGAGQSYRKFTPKKDNSRFESIQEGVIVGLGSDPMNPEVAVLGGAGTYDLKTLYRKVKREAKQLAEDIDNGEFAKSFHNIKQVQNTLKTILTAHRELNDIRRKGGVKSRGLSQLEVPDSGLDEEMLLKQLSQEDSVLKGLSDL